jgi:hypothetical protein
LEPNLYLYAEANPIIRTDPAGITPGLEGLTGPAALGLCFAIHSGSQIPGGEVLLWELRAITAKQAVDICKLAYSKDAWAMVPFGESPTSGHNLFGKYVNESSGDRLLFTAKDPLTKELSQSNLLMSVRRDYLQSGDTIGPKESRYNLAEQAACLTEGYWHDGPSLPVTCVLGSVYYQLKTLNTDQGSFVGFRIDNRTDLESGSHIAFRYTGDVSGNMTFGGSVEDLISSRQIRQDESVLDVMNRVYGGKKVVSILSPLDRTKTGWYTGSLGTHELGGGNLIQTFAWMEPYDPCDQLSRLSFYISYLHSIQEWISWGPPITKPITRWDELF